MSGNFTNWTSISNPPSAQTRGIVPIVLATNYDIVDPSTPIQLPFTQDFNLYVTGNITNPTNLHIQWSLDNITFYYFKINGVNLAFTGPGIQYFLKLDAGVWLRLLGSTVTGPNDVNVELR